MRDLVQKALYLGVGIATYAAEKANTNLKDLTNQAQKLAETLVERGEMNAEEAKRYVDDLIKDAQGQSNTIDADEPASSPRRIEILTDDEEESANITTASDSSPENTEDVEVLRRQVAVLQAELDRLNGSTGRS